MDMQQLIGDLTTVKASAQVAEGKVTELTASVATLSTENAELKKQMAEVEPIKAKLAETEASLDASQKDLEAANGKIAELEASIKTRDALQAAGVQPGGNSKGSADDAGKGPHAVSGKNQAFKTR